MNAPAPYTRLERALAILLCINGVVTGLAIFPTFMPLDWMHDIHQRLHLGRVPQGPIFEYMARTLSALYAIHGGLCFVLARDVRRFGPIITYVAAVGIAFAALVLWIDNKVGLPGVWTAIEAPSILLFAGIILSLRLRNARVPGAG